MTRTRDKKGSYTRPENTREARGREDKPENLLIFSFKSLDETQPKDDIQSIKSWGASGLLSSLFEKLKNLSKLTRNEAEEQKQIKIYNEFPPNSDFFHPRHVDNKVAWGVIKSVGSQKGTVAGYIIENIFYIVFLDQNHRFWITEKKGT